MAVMTPRCHSTPSERRHKPPQNPRPKVGGRHTGDRLAEDGSRNAVERAQDVPLCTASWACGRGLGLVWAEGQIGVQLRVQVLDPPVKE